MAVATFLTSISRKVPPSEPPAAVTGISFLSAYLFAMMYPSASENSLHPSDNSSPVSSFKRITVACQSGSLTPLPLVTLAAACRRFDNLFIKVHFHEQTMNDESFLFSLSKHILSREPHKSNIYFLISPQSNRSMQRKSPLFCFLDHAPFLKETDRIFKNRLIAVFFKRGCVVLFFHLCERFLALLFHPLNGI